MKNVHLEFHKDIKNLIEQLRAGVLAIELA